MLVYINWLLPLLMMVFTNTVYACDINQPCEKCAKASEFSWNPDNHYVSARLNRFYNLDQEMTTAYEAKDFVNLKALATENLALAKIYQCNWNFGNAIHESNRYLGLISLKNGDIHAAAEYLIRAGDSTGSPQLNTFGPNLDLADKLLQQGEVDAVTHYLKAVRKFWEMDHGMVDKWLLEIQSGEKPRLNRQAAAETSMSMLVVFWVTACWPFLISAYHFAIYNKRMTRKLLFFFISIPCGYAAMFITNMGLQFLIESNISRLAKFDTGSIALLIIYLELAIVLSLPFALNVLIIRKFLASPSR